MAARGMQDEGAVTVYAIASVLLIAQIAQEAANRAGDSKLCERHGRRLGRERARRAHETAISIKWKPIKP